MRGADCLSICCALCIAISRTGGIWNTTARMRSVRAAIDAPIRAILSLDHDRQ